MCGWEREIKQTKENKLKILYQKFDNNTYCRSINKRLGECFFLVNNHDDCSCVNGRVWFTADLFYTRQIINVRKINYYIYIFKD